MHKHLTSIMLALSIVSAMLPAEARYSGYASYGGHSSGGYGGYGGGSHGYGGYNNSYGGYGGNHGYGGMGYGGYNNGYGGYRGNSGYGGYNNGYGGYRGYGGYNNNYGGYGNNHWNGYNGGYNNTYLGNGHWGGFNGGYNHGYNNWNGGYNRGYYPSRNYYNNNYYNNVSYGYGGYGGYGGGYGGYGYGGYGGGYNPYLNPFFGSAGISPFGYGGYGGYGSGAWNSTWPFILGMTGTTLAASVASSIINSSNVDRSYYNSSASYGQPAPPPVYPQAQSAGYSAYSESPSYVATSVPVGYVASTTSVGPQTASAMMQSSNNGPFAYPPSIGFGPQQPNSLAYNILPPVAPRLTGMPPVGAPMGPQDIAAANQAVGVLSGNFVDMVNGKYHSNIQSALRDPEGLSFAKSIGLVDPNSPVAPRISSRQEHQIKKILRDSVATPPDKVQGIATVLQPTM